MTDFAGASSETAPAVKILNCKKAYETVRWWQKTSKQTSLVLDNLTLTVEQGSIYALLGPSGCGKTTLIKCILGRLRVNSGTIGIFGRQLGSHGQTRGAEIGYMPQETSMFAVLTIEETLAYYGQIIGLSKKFIKCQTDLLVEFLKLPPKDTVNNKLSGGQLRRLSFAAATFHNPKLLILDEPTVGVDPIGRQRMWCYLRYIARNFATTIILSTHYIEEARTVDKVGLMQDGTMLEEDAPTILLTKWNVPTLEELFFKVYSNHLENNLNCNAQETSTNQPTSEITAHMTDCVVDQMKDDYESNILEQQINQTLVELQPPNNFVSRKGSSLKISRMMAIINKNFISLSRHPATIFFLVFLPPIGIAMSMVAISGTFSNLAVGFLNEDKGPFGKIYLDLLNRDVVMQTEHTSYYAGHKAVADGENVGFIYIPNNFSDTINERFVNVNLLSEDDLKDGFLNLTFDPTDLYVAQTLFSQLAKTIQDVAAKALLDAGRSANLSRSFIQVNYLPKDLDGLSPAFSYVPTQLLLTIFCIQLVTSMFLFFLEKNNNILERTLVSGVTYVEIVTGHVFLYFCLNLVQTAGMLLVIFGIFQMPMLGSVGLIAAVNVLSGFTGMSAGLLLAVITDQLIILGTIVIVLMFAAPSLAGMIWPVESSPYFFQIFCMFMPFYLPVDAMNDVLYRNLGIFHADVITAIALLIVWILVLTSLSIFCLRRRVS